MHKLLHDLLCPAISRGCSASRKRRARGSQANRHSPAAAKQPQTNPSVQPLLRDLGQRATTLLLQPLPSWPQLPKSRPHTRDPAAWVLGPTSTFPCSQGFLPSAARVGTKEGDLRLAPARWIHHSAASGPPSTTLPHCLVPRDEPASCTHPRLDGACKPRGTWIFFFFFRRGRENRGK